MAKQSKDAGGGKAFGAYRISDLVVAINGEVMGASL